MKIKLRQVVVIWLTLFSTTFVYAQKFDKADFYEVMSAGKMADIDRELAAITDSEQGYAGALLMRKAGLVKLPKDKLKYFKEGRIKLETALSNEPENTEYHFLRLTIEEHAPKIVKYKAGLQTDRLFVISHFSNLPEVVKKAVKDYARTSAVLKTEDINLFFLTKIRSVSKS